MTRHSTLTATTLLALAGSFAFASTIPVAIQSSGVDGSQWRTRLLIHGSQYDTTASILCDPDSDEPSWEYKWDVLSRVTLERNLGLGDFFQGHLEIRGGIDFAQAIISTDRLGGEVGQVMTMSTYLEASEPRLLVGLSGTEGRRSNVGWVNGEYHPHEVELTLFAADGRELGHLRVVEDGHDHRQINDIFASIGVTPEDSAWAMVRSTGKTHAYGSVIGAGHDPASVIPPATFTSGVVAVVADSVGFDATHWQSDLWLVVPGDEAATVRLILRTDQGIFEEELEIAGWNQRHLPDLVARTFGRTGLRGVLEIESTVPIAGRSRTWTTTAHGDVGQDVSVIPRTRMLRSGEIGVVAGARLDDDHRSNLMISSLAPTDVVIRVYDAEGQQIADLELVIDGSFLAPIEDLLGADLAPRAASFELEGQGIISLLSIIDRRTQDPVTMLQILRSR